MGTTNSWDFFPVQLPEELKSKAILLYESLGVYDIAWDVESIFKVINLLHSNSVMILGGDVLAKRNNNYDFTGDNWNENGFDEERGYNTAKTFIKEYIAQHGNNFIFTLVCRSNL